MSISNTTNTIREAGNGSKTAFDFPFKIYSVTDLKVYKVLNSNETRTLMVYGTDYTVNISTTAEGGTVTYVTAPTSLQDSFIERDRTYNQSVNIPAVGGVREEQLETGLDKLCILILQLLKKVQLSLKFVSSSPLTDVEVPQPSAGKVLGWSDDELTLENLTLVQTTTAYSGNITKGTDASKSATPSPGDIHISTDTRIEYRCFSSNVWTPLSVISNSIRVSKSSHGFSVKDVLYHNGTTYAKATADTEAHAVVVGMVSEVIDSDTFILATAGYVSGLSGLTAGSLYYLSPSTAGLLTATQPTTIGYVVKPIFTAISTTEGFLNIGASALVRSLPTGYIYGVNLSNNVADASNDIDISAGKLRDTNDLYDVTVAALTKRIDAAWAAGSAAGGMFTGSVANDTTYHIFIIRNDTTGAVDAGFDTSTTGANKPSGWTVMRRIGAVRYGTAALLKFYQFGKGPIRKVLYDLYRSVLSTSSPASSMTDIDCSAFIPAGATLGIFNAQSLGNNGTGTTTTFNFRPNGSSSTQTITFLLTDGHGAGASGCGGYFECPVDSSGIIEYQSVTQQIELKLGVVGYYETL